MNVKKRSLQALFIQACVIGSCIFYAACGFGKTEPAGASAKTPTEDKKVPHTDRSVLAIAYILSDQKYRPRLLYHDDMGGILRGGAIINAVRYDFDWNDEVQTLHLQVDTKGRNESFVVLLSGEVVGDSCPEKKKRLRSALREILFHCGMGYTMP